MKYLVLFELIFSFIYFYFTKKPKIIELKKRMDFLLTVKNDLKKDVINYYDEIKSEIDISGQLVLIKLEKSKMASPINDDSEHNDDLVINDIDRQEVVEIYEKMILKVDQTCNSNLIEIDSYFNKEISSLNLSCLSKDEIRRKCLRNNLIYFRPIDLNDESSEMDLYDLGLLIYYESFMDDNQLNYIR